MHRCLAFMIMKWVGCVFINFLILSFHTQVGFAEDSIISETAPTTDTLSVKNSPPFVVISDFDDTIKITHVLAKNDAVRNGFFRNDTFLGMSTLFQQWNLAAESLVYLSGSPQLMRRRIENTLVQNAFPLGDLILSNWLHKWTRWQNVYSFKLSALMNERRKRDVPFVLMGDDTQSDAQAFSDFRAHDPALQASIPIYIHRVTGRPLPDGVIGYATAFEVALNELEDARLTPLQTMEVGKAILNSDRFDLLFPNFVKCPMDLSFGLGSVGQGLPELVALSNALERKIVTYCWEMTQDYL